MKKISSRLNIEQSLLVDLVKSAVSGKEYIKTSRMTAETVDWDFLIRFSSFHCLNSILFKALESLQSDVVPSEKLYILDNYHRSNTMRCGLLFDRLRDVFDLLSSHGIEPLTFKGPVMACELYGDKAFREYSDIDILVHPGSLRKAMDLISSNGYNPDIDMPDSYRGVYEKYGYYYSYFAEKDNTILDLHWRLLPSYLSFSPDTDYVMSQSRQVTVDDYSFLTINPELMIVYLAIHGAKHSWVQLNWLLDLALMAGKEGVVWDEVIDISERYNCRRMLFAGLLLASSVFGPGIPGDIIFRAESDADAVRLREDALSILFPRKGGFRHRLDIGLYFYGSMESNSDRAKFFHDTVLKPTLLEWESVKLPPALYFLYYVVRPLRLGMKYALGKS